MLLKRAEIRIDANSIIDRDLLLFGPRKKASFMKHDISDNIVAASNPIDIVAEIGDGDPDDWVVFRTRAIDAGGSDKTGEEYHGPNDNGDWFSEEELLAEGEDGVRAFETFIGCPVFTNHKNDDVEQSRGRIVNAFYDNDQHCVYVDGLIDAKAYPELGRGVVKGYISDTSMGCSVKSSTCSICKNIAETEDQYCSHIQNHKGKKIQGNRVYEENHAIKFIENSFVTDGACENCTVQNAYTGLDLINKLRKTISASNDNLVSMRKVASLDKEARGDDIDKLNQSLDLLKEVADQILNSKDVDFEFLEDIGGLLAELQNLIVDLVEAGFANQTGEGIGEKGGPEEDAVSQTPSGGQSSQELTAPISGPPMAPGGLPSGPPGGPPGVPGAPAPAAMPASPLISTTMKKELNKRYGNKLKELEEIGKELNILVSSLHEYTEKIGDDNMLTKKQKARKNASNIIAGKFAQLLDEQIAESDPVVVTDGDFSVSFDPKKGIEGYVKGKKVASLSADELGEELTEAAKITPQIVAGRLIQKLSENFNENGERKMAQNDEITKEALLTQVPPVDKVQEGQLEDMNGNFDRKNDEQLAVGQVGVTTQKQLEDIPQTPETGKGDFDRIRPEGITENLEITEGQLDDARPTNFGVDRQEPNAAEAKGQLGQIQEGQMEDEKYGSERWEDDVADGSLPITEDQFEGKDRLGTAVDEVQEGQVEGHRLGTDKVQSSDASPHGKKASVQDKVITAFINGLANASVSNRIKPAMLIAHASLTPEGIISHTASSLKKAAKVSAGDITRLAEYEISEEIGSANMDIASEYLQDTIDTLFDDSAILEDAIETAVDERGDVEIVDEVEQRKASVASAWKTRSAKKREIRVTREQLVEQLGLTDATTVTDDVVKEHIMRANGGRAILSFDTNPDGSYSALILTNEADTSTIEQQQTPGMPQQPHMDVPGTEAPIAEEGLVSADIVEKLQKIAQSPQGTTMPPAGGMPPEGGMGAAPPAGIENLGGDAGAEDIIGDALEDDLGEETGEALPFGSFCIVCKSDNVDALDGKFNCNDCGAKYELSVNTNLLNPENFADVGMAGETEDEETEGEDINEELGEEPMADDMGMGAPPAAPAPAPMPGMAHSSAWVKTATLKYDIHVDPKAFIGNGRKITAGSSRPVGAVCPQCTSTRVAFKDSEGTCVDCGCQSSVKATKGDGVVDVEMIWQPNLTLAAEERFDEDGKSLGRAITADCENCDEVSQALHEILSNRKDLVRLAASTEEKNPMLACMSDQIGNGYTDEDSIQICASIKDMILKKALIIDDDDTEEKKEDTGIDLGNDDEKDEVEDKGSENTFEEADDDEIEDEDFTEFEGDDDDNVEFEGEEGPKDITDELGGVEEVTGLTVEFTDSSGNAGEFTLSSDGDDLNGIEELGPEEDVVIEEIEEVEPEELLEGPGEEVNDDDVMGDFFTDQTRMFDKPQDQMAEESRLMTPEEAKMESLQKSELLRGSRVQSSERVAGMNMDLGKVAQALGMASMPGDTEADVPRNKEQGIVEEDGVEVHKSEHKNEAKKMKGTGAGSTLADDDATQGSDRGVEVIKPKTQASAEGMTKTAQMADPLYDPHDDPGLDPTSVVEQVMAENPPVIEEMTPDEDIVDYENTFKAEERLYKNLVSMGMDPGTAKQKVTGLAEEALRGTEEPALEMADSQIEAAPVAEAAPMSEGTELIAGEKVKMTVKEAQHAAPQQTEPVDGLQEDKVGPNSDESSLEVPRDESKANPEIDPGDKSVNNPTEVRETKYDLGPGATNLHNNAVVPRDDSGDGLGGENPKFDDESGDKQTTGNPGSYVQENQETPDPTPAGDADNHATTGPNTASKKEMVMKIAEAKGIEKKNILVAEKDGKVFVKDASTKKVYKVAEAVCVVCNKYGNECTCCPKCKSTPCECSQASKGTELDKKDDVEAKVETDVEKVAEKKECEKCECEPCKCEKKCDDASLKADDSSLEAEASKTDLAIRKVAEKKEIDPTNLEAVEQGDYVLVLDTETDKIYKV